jgi:hypothetical protein
VQYSYQKKTKSLAGEVDLALWQCISPHSTFDKTVFYKETNTVVETSTVLI